MKSEGDSKWDGFEVDSKLWAWGPMCRDTRQLRTRKGDDSEHGVALLKISESKIESEIMCRISW